MQETYQPSPEVLERLKQVDFVAVVGPTAAGKSTLITAATARDPQLHIVMNNTSRPPRPGERDGVDFLFRSRADMLAELRERRFAQVLVHPSGELYATKGDAYATEGIALLPVLAEVLPVFRALPWKRLRVVYILPPSPEVWQARIDQHGFTAEQLAGRLAEARRSLQIAIDDPSVQFVINESLAHATDDFIALLKGIQPSGYTQAEARELAKRLLGHLPAA